MLTAASLSLLELFHTSLVFQAIQLLKELALGWRHEIHNLVADGIMPEYGTPATVSVNHLR